MRDLSVYDPLDPSSYDPLSHPLVLLANHVLIPAAIIGMVASILFYLIELRSIFLPGGLTLKWVGLCFVVANVLIVRYRKMMEGGGGELVYSIALAGATISVVLVAPWDAERADQQSDALASIAILAGLWWYCRAVADSLSQEEAWALPQERKLFGEEAEQLARWRRRRAEETGQSAHQDEKTARGPRADPSQRVKRLIMAAIVLFAIGEPLILNGPPGSGAYALAAVASFLFCASFVLSAASTIHAIRNVTHAQGRFRYEVLWQRLGAAAALSALLVLGALALPGITYKGSGLLQPRLSPGPQVTPRGDDELSEELDEEQGTAGGQTCSTSPQTGSSLPALMGMLMSFSRIVLAVIVSLALIGLLFAIVRNRHRIAGFAMNARRRLRSILRALAGRLLARRAPAADRSDRTEDPYAGLEELSHMDPVAAVKESYRRLLTAVELEGYARQPRQTPHELLESLPRDLAHLRPPIEKLTLLYVLTAYAEEPAGARERDEALGALRELRAVRS